VSELCYVNYLCGYLVVVLLCYYCGCSIFVAMLGVGAVVLLPCGVCVVRCPEASSPIQNVAAHSLWRDLGLLLSWYSDRYGSQKVSTVIASTHLTVVRNLFYAL
jgi:hypothetical protein